MPKISQLPVSDTLDGSELIELVQNGANKRTQVNSLFFAGKSAYDLAVDAGFVGTLNEYVASLKGEPGLQGTNGLDGPQGIPGTAGTPGLQGIQGIPGTAGAQGDPGLQGIQGPKGDTGLTGTAGKTAYQSAVDAGFVGTEAQWVESLTPSQAGVVIVTHTFTASEALIEGDIVNIWNNAGVPKVRKTDASVENKHAHGFILATVALGEVVTVYFAGVNNKCTGLVIGDQYLSTTPGITSPFTPNMSGQVLQTVGLAISATTMFFNPSDAATLA